MQFLADEDFPLKSVQLLREAGFDVAATIVDSPGAKDWQVLSRATEEHRLILTFDRDYGELIFRRKLPPPPGVVFFRFAPQTPEEPAEFLLKLMAISGLQLGGKFTVIKRKQVRQRPIS